MKSKFLTLLCSFLILFSVNAHAFTLNDATSFDPIPVQVQAASIGVPVGTVIVWTREEIPEGWLECNGQPVPSEFPDLLALMPNVPDYRDRFLQGTNTNKKIGDKIEPGLPNITGNVMVGYGVSGAIDGAFYQSKIVGNMQEIGIANAAYAVGFSAQNSNAIYGRSTTVQPPSVTVKYLIKAE